MGSLEQSEVDVLIIGAGPAGLMAANWMSRLGIKTRIVDKRADKINAGQADGIQSRTLEIWDSFGIADRALREGLPYAEVCVWAPDKSGKITRSSRMQSAFVQQSRFPQLALHQGKTEETLLDTIHEHSDIRVERATLPERIELATGEDEYPVTITLRHLRKADATQTKGPGKANGLYRSNLVKDDTEDLIRKGQEHSSDVEVVKAKYVVGCDGAHSWTRKQLGFTMEGEQTDSVWGVVDIVPITDFPDIRTINIIQSADSGTLLLIARENKLVRLYVPLRDVSASKESRSFDISSITPESILESARKILHPYKLSYVHCHWWTVYRIGQRVSNHYDKANRIFLAGDAVHTHSPKGGQGQNVSMQDTYNLGWKIGMVIKGQLRPSVLETYVLERQAIARELIEFDHKLTKLYAQKDGELDETVADGIKEIYRKNGEFMAGLGVDYSQSALTVKSASKQHLAPGIPLGKRFASQTVVAQPSGRPWALQSLLRSTGHFRIVIFGGNISQSALLERVNTLGVYLRSHILPRYTKSGGRSCPIELLLVHCAPRISVELLSDLNDAYHEFDEEMGYDYDRVFVDELDWFGKEGKAYETYEVAKTKGCMVIVRPDQYVSWIGELEDVEEMSSFFDSVLIKQE